MRLFCFGMGYVAQHLADALRPLGWRVAGSSRSARHLLGPDRPLDAAGLADLRAATHVLASIPPQDEAGGDPALHYHAAELGGKWIGYLSTTGVYGDWQGEWVDETSPLHAAAPRSLRRIAAENRWQAHGAEVFRLAGIYGPRRNALVQLRAGAARRIHKPGHYFSRMHVEDIVQALCAAMAQPQAGAVYNLCDDTPAPGHEVIAYASRLLGMEPPPLVPYDKAGSSPMAQSFYADNRRVRNDKIKSTLGVRLRYPGYREGLASLLHQGEGV